MMSIEGLCSYEQTNLFLVVLAAGKQRAKCYFARWVNLKYFQSVSQTIKRQDQDLYFNVTRSKGLLSIDVLQFPIDDICWLRLLDVFLTLFSWLPTVLTFRNGTDKICLTLKISIYDVLSIMLAWWQALVNDFLMTFALSCFQYFNTILFDA